LFPDFFEAYRTKYACYAKIRKQHNGKPKQNIDYFFNYFVGDLKDYTIFSDNNKVFKVFVFIFHKFMKENSMCHIPIENFLVRI